MKMHEVDERLDEIDTLVQLFEAKLDSLPPEVFTDMPPIVQTLANQIPLTLTENPLGPPQPPPPIAVQNCKKIVF
jgi:hypothetical protein